VSADVHVLVDPTLSVSKGHMIRLLVGHRLKPEIDETTDGKFHIDPEGDDTIAPQPTYPSVLRSWHGWPPRGPRSPPLQSGGARFCTTSPARHRCGSAFSAGDLSGTRLERGNDPSLLRQHSKPTLAHAPESRELQASSG